MNKRDVVVVFCIFGVLTAFLSLAGSKKQYPIALLAPDFERGSLLMQALKERKSTRIFKNDDLSLDILSNLLWAACGVNRPNKKKLTVPSGSNSQGIEVYVAMKSGLYFYNRYDHVLEPVHSKDIRMFTSKHNFTHHAAVNLIYVANTKKLTGTFSRKEGLRFSTALIEIGCIVQNVYLFCASEGLVTVVLGYVDRDKLTKEMNLPEYLHVIVAQPLGYPVE